MKKTILKGIIFLLFHPAITFAQNTEFKISTTGIASSGNTLPFWIASNQKGMYDQANSSSFVTTAGFEKAIENDSIKKIGFTYGANLVYSLADRSDFHINEAYAGIRYSWLDFTVGAKADPVKFFGLSSTNGDILASNNARSVPKLSIATNRNIYISQRFSFTAKFEEGILNDDRFIENPHFHHKNLFLHHDFNKNWQVSFGLEHYVMWGGTHPEKGSNPTGIVDYIRYISGLAGGEEATQSDQKNAAGNHLGGYLLTIKKEWKNCAVTINWNNIFEDASGRELANLPDGIYRMFFDFSKKQQVFSYFLYEFYHTKDQSDKPTPFSMRSKDNYFNNGYYRSGYTYHQRTIGSPFFTPKINEQGISEGIYNNRFTAHHFGVGGVSKKILWKSLFSITKNYGTPHDGEKFEKSLSQFSFLTEFTLREGKIPFDLTLRIARDNGDLLEKQLGVQILLAKRF